MAVAPNGAVTLSCESPLVVDGHLEPLRRALHNLVDNAVRAASGAEIRGYRHAANDTDWVHLEIVDHGPGIPEHLASRIFDPYITGRDDGTGLGLTLVRQTIAAHGGRVWADETPGGGATLHIELPATI
jgi:signal transduction histidine kinase